MADGNPSASIEEAQALVREPFDALKAAYARDRYPSYGARLDALDTLLNITIEHQDAIADAVRRDFGHRSVHDTKIADLFTTIAAIKYIKKHLKAWMAPQRRKVELTFMPGSNRVELQPLGVVGIISPWNYPYQLAASPLACALAAGNRVMLKPSELTPAFSALMAELFHGAFPSDLVRVVQGDATVAAAFSGLPFDHLLFTGSTQVGRYVMEAAAKNLTPVTLELGGKSPAIIHPTYSTDKAAARIAAGKLINAGQTCIAPDYVLVHEGDREAFVSAMQADVPKHFPSLDANDDYTAIVNDRHFTRIQKLVDDAEAKGATKVVINPANESMDSGLGKMAPTLLLDCTDEMDVMHEEIFGPVMPVVTYQTLEEAIEYVNERPRPLALYYFDNDKARADDVLRRTVSGGACVNETLLHQAQEDMPFGGVGPSGIGAYHGKEGFETFSHKKAVFRQAPINSAALLAPPYGPRIEALLKVLMRR